MRIRYALLLNASSSRGDVAAALVGKEQYGSTGGRSPKELSDRVGSWRLLFQAKQQPHVSDAC